MAVRDGTGPFAFRPNFMNAGARAIRRIAFIAGGEGHWFLIYLETRAIASLVAPQEGHAMYYEPLITREEREWMKKHPPGPVGSAIQIVVALVALGTFYWIIVRGILGMLASPRPSAKANSAT